MLSCVIQQELMLASRRQRAHLLRWIYAGFVVVQLLPTFLGAASFSDWLGGNGFGDFFERFVVLHFGLLALLTPALLAGAITDEKTSGTLQYLLTAQLSSWEIVLGKMLARTYQLVLMCLAGLPLICWFSGFGGLASLPAALVVLSLALIVGLAGASMLASVWCRQTRDALLTVYLLGLGLFGLAAVAGWRRVAALADTFQPLQALVLDNAAVNWSRVGHCVLAWTVLGAFCLALATLRLRGAYLRQLRQTPRPERRWLPARRPRIRTNPVLWRERYVVGLAPWPWFRSWPRWLGCVLVAAATFGSFAASLERAVPGGANVISRLRQGQWRELRAALRAAPGVNDIFYWHGLAALLALSFVVVVRASGCIADEREKETWQALLQTPLTTRAILRGKQWGILGASVPYLATYALVALAWSLCVGVMATVWTVLWLAATVFAVLVGVAVGIWCSARFRSSWLSLLATLGLCYVGWIALSGPVLVGAWFIQGLIGIMLEFIDWLYDIGPVVGAVAAFNPAKLALGCSLVAAFWFLTHRLLVAAERLVARRDRAKEVDPQFHEFHARWLRHIQLTAHVPKPIDPALDEPLPLHEEVGSEI